METQSESRESQAWLGSPWSTLTICAQGYGDHPAFSLADSKPVIHMQLLSSVRSVDTLHTEKGPDSLRGGTDRHLPLLGPPGPGAAGHGGARPDPDRRLGPGDTGVLLRPHHELFRAGENRSGEGQHPLPCHPTLLDSGQGAELPGEDSSPRGHAQCLLRRLTLKLSHKSGIWMPVFAPAQINQQLVSLWHDNGSCVFSLYKIFFFFFFKFK